MSDIVSIQDLQDFAYKALPKNALDYYKSGSTSETTLQNNRKAFSKLRIRPRFLKDVSEIDLTTTVLGTRVSMPIGISPTAMQRMAHPEGECANAKAAEAMGTIFILSTISTSSIEEVAEAAPNATKWFQLYVYKDREVTKDLVQRAERAGFKALVLTVDAPMFGIRYADVRNNFQLPPHLKLGNFVGSQSTPSQDEGQRSAINAYIKKLGDPSLEWNVIKWLQSITTLPIILKGILTAEDAMQGVNMGVSGIFVSNHGARQVDGVPASIEALPDIVKAVGDKVEVYIDGGFQEGTDIFKALCLGAKMVFLGRPALWGLTYKGESGVKLVLSILKAELENTLALTGCTSVNNIPNNMVVHKNFYSHL